MENLRLKNQISFIFFYFKVNIKTESIIFKH